MYSSPERQHMHFVQNPQYDFYVQTAFEMWYIFSSEVCRRLTYITKLDMYGVLRSVAAIFGGKTVCVTYMSRSPFVMFSLQVKQIRETCPA